MTNKAQGNFISRTFDAWKDWYHREADKIDKADKARANPGWNPSYDKYDGKQSTHREPSENVVFSKEAEKYRKR